MASNIQGVPLDKLDESLLEDIATRHSDFRHPVEFVRNRWGRAGHENVLAALQELQTMWKSNVRAAAPAYEQAVRNAALEETKAMIDLQWLSEQNKNQLKGAIDRLKSPHVAPESMQPDTDAASYKRMFKSAAHALALINAALDIDPDDAGGAGPILEAIEKLKASQSLSNQYAYLWTPPDFQGENQYSQ